VILKLKQALLAALHNSKNISERSIVEGMIRGYLHLIGQTLPEESVQKILRTVIPNEQARYMHLFQGGSYRENITNSFEAEAELIDSLDASALKIGLGHFAAAGEKHIKGKQECTQFLNSLVEANLMSLIAELKKYNREALIKIALRNIENINVDRKRWERTASAYLGLHEDKEMVYGARAKHFSELNAGGLASRIIIEISVCESPPDGGIIAGKSDLSPLMARASMIFLIGNISDGIHKGVISPEILITPDGDVKTEQTFQDEVMDPMSRQNEQENLDSDAEKYQRFFSQRESAKPKEDFTKEFLAAFEAETSVGVDDVVTFISILQNIGYDKDRLTFRMTEEELKTACTKENLLNDVTVSRIISSFALTPREQWKSPPAPYIVRDILPWLFRRRLSMLFRPLVKINNNENPVFYIAPAFLLDAFVHRIDLYRHCIIEEDRCLSEQMAAWIGGERDRKGREFTLKVAGILQRLGYKVKTEVLISSIIPAQHLDRDYGDFDIIAWKEVDSDQQLFLIECKDLFFAKTFREVAEQLQEFRGELRNGRPDQLKKHIDRIEIARKHTHLLSAFCGVTIQSKISGQLVFSRRVPILFVQRTIAITITYVDELEHTGLK
ncbi:MAG TPA: hypothetical protein VG737_09080, partial [Cyclobacteriaceae bacterium]|nr:hypothetical protein [Cyclobacteriaceae bacterium]